MAQPALPIPKNLSRQFEPVGSAAAAARSYAQQIGTSWSAEGLGDVQSSEERKHATALAYRDAMSQPEAPDIRASYDALNEHVNRQYAHMTRPVEEGGMGLRHEVTPHDPYAFGWSGGSDEKAAQAMSSDVRGGRIKTLATATSASDESTTGITRQTIPDDVNDRFRAVHDVFGHAAIGRGFSRHGEEAAFQSHAQMFPKEALPALAAETRGQNTYLNTFGEFPDPGGKAIRLPDWAHDPSAPIPPRSPFRNPERRTPTIRYKQPSLFE
jgi:hypothetical protein